jgi:hypothetical protein
MPVLADLQAVAERHLGPIDDQRYGFGDAEKLEQLIRASGFRDVSVEVLERTVRFDVGAHFIGLNAMAFVGMSRRAATMTADERTAALERVAAESLQIVPRSSIDGALEFVMSTNLAIARA